MECMGSSSRGAHAQSLCAAREIFAAREKAARFFGCENPAGVVFSSNATEALNTAVCGILRPGDHVITTDMEHNSVLRPLYRMEAEQGVALDFVRADKRGALNYGDFGRLIRKETRAVICTHASNLTGDVVDVARVGKFAREWGLLFVVDAAQTAGILPIHMGEMNIDILCFTGHKGLLGPQGTGGLCIRTWEPIRPLKTGGTGIHSFSRTQPGQLPEALEAGTLNGHGIAGLSAAFDYICREGRETIQKRETALMTRFYQGVKEIPGVRVYGDFTGVRAPIVTLNLGDRDSGEISHILDRDYGIATRPGAHCAPRLHEALGTKEQGAVRFSFSWYNTDTEVDMAIRAIREIQA